MAQLQKSFSLDVFSCYMDMVNDKTSKARAVMQSAWCHLPQVAVLRLLVREAPQIKTPDAIDRLSLAAVA